MIVTRNILQDFINPVGNEGIFELEGYTLEKGLIKTVNNSVVNFIEFNVFIHPDDKANPNFYNPVLIIETEKFRYWIDNLMHYDNRLYRIDFNEYFKRFRAFIVFDNLQSVDVNLYRNTFRVKINYNINFEDVKKSLKIPNNIKNLRLIK